MPDNYELAAANIVRSIRSLRGTMSTPETDWPLLNSPLRGTYPEGVTEP